MDIDLPSSATDFGSAVDAVLRDLGGVEFARAMERSYRPEALASSLSALGIDDIRPRADMEQAAVAAEACRAAGRHLAPFPFASVMLQDEQGRPFTVVPADGNLVDHGRARPEWTGVASDGTGVGTFVSSGVLGSKLGPFVSTMTLVEGKVRDDPFGALLRMTFDSWTVIGALQRSLELVIDHLKSRYQFGRPLSDFQAIQHEVADAVVATDGLLMLAKFTLWRLWHADPRFHRGDVLALRLSTLETARTVLRTCQQFFGASGLCAEYDISVIVRHLQPILRMPMALHQVLAELADSVNRVGFQEIYPHGALIASGRPA